MNLPNLDPEAEVPLRELHDEIRRRLRAKDVRMSELSARSKVPRQVLYALREPGSNPKAHTLERVADALGLRVRVKG